MEVSSPGNEREKAREGGTWGGQQGRRKAREQKERQEGREVGGGERKEKQINWEERQEGRRYPYQGCKAPAYIVYLIL